MARAHTGGGHVGLRQEGAAPRAGGGRRRARLELRCWRRTRSRTVELLQRRAGAVIDITERCLCRRPKAGEGRQAGDGRRRATMEPESSVCASHSSGSAAPPAAAAPNEPRNCCRNAIVVAGSPPEACPPPRVWLSEVRTARGRGGTFLLAHSYFVAQAWASALPRALRASEGRKRCRRTLWRLRVAAAAGSGHALS